jgi:hypothetical protein
VLWTAGSGIYLGQLGGTFQVRLVAGMINKLIASDGYIYWSDGSGAIGKIEIPD